MKLIRLIRHAESAANAGLSTTAPDSIPLTEKDQLQARAFADSFTSAPNLIISSPFERAIATALPTTERFPHVPFEMWPVEEFTYLSPNRFAGTTQADRKPHAESFWENGDAEFTDGPGAESFDHLLGRADAMLSKLANSNAQNILVYSHGQFIRAAAWLIKHGATLVHTNSCVNSELTMYGNRLEIARVISLCSATAAGQLNARSTLLIKRDLATISAQASVLGDTVSAKLRCLAYKLGSFGVT